MGNIHTSIHSPLSREAGWNMRRQGPNLTWLNWVGKWMNRDNKTSVKNVLWQADVTGKEGRVQEAPSTCFFPSKIAL